MTDVPKSPHSARSRTPIDEAGVKWWELFGNNEPRTSEYYVQNESTVVDEKVENKTSHRKSTGTNILDAQREIVSKNYENLKHIDSKVPKDKVLKKWREEQAKAKYEQARKAVINSLKEKFRDVPCSNIRSNTKENKIDIRKIIPTIIITGDNVEGTSNLNANRGGESQGNLGFMADGFRVGITDGAGEDGSHARRLQMGPGGELAQWRLAPRGSRAAGAEGGLRGLARENMPVSYSTFL